MRVATLVVSVIVLAGALGVTASAGAAAFGSLSQLPGPSGCLSTSGNAFGCAVGSAVRESTSAAVSPDGRNVYVAATNTPGVEVLSRNPATGAVTQLAGTNGCVTSDGTDDAGTAGACGIASGLGEPGYVTVSPDGRSVYVTNSGSNTILVFSRDGSTGALSQVQCLGDTTGPPAGCSASEPDLLGDAHAVVVSADGAHVYAVSGQGGTAGAVLVLNRNAATGMLTLPAGAAKCVTLDGQDGTGTAGACGTARSLNEPYHLALSPDGRQLYVAASEGDRPSTGDGAVVTLSVQANGSLLQPSGPAGCLSRSGTGNAFDPAACARGKPAHDLNGVAVSPDGRSVYAASAGNGGDSTPGAVEILSRDPATGNLTQDVATTAGCLSVDGTDGFDMITGSCATARGIGETYRITVSPDGATVYVASQGTLDSSGTFPGTIGVFSRSANGALTQLPGSDGCISDSTRNDSRGGTTCAPGRALEGAYQLVLSPDCTSAYVAAQNSPGLAVFSRMPCLTPPPPPPPPPPSGGLGGNAGNGGSILGTGGSGGDAGACGGAGGGGGGVGASGGAAGGGGCFSIPSGQRIGSGRLVAFVQVGQANSTISADARASLASARGARVGRLALLGRTLTRGVPAGRYRLIVKFSARARRRLAARRRARVTVHITLTAPNGASASATRTLTMKR